MTRDMNISLHGKLAPTIRIGYKTDIELVEVLKQILSLPPGKHFVIGAHGQGNFELHFLGKMENVREMIYQWLSKVDRTKDFSSIVELPNVVSLHKK